MKIPSHAANIIGSIAVAVCGPDELTKLARELSVIQLVYVAAAVIGAALLIGEILIGKRRVRHLLVFLFVALVVGVPVFAL
jgi:hypothetical protein